MNEIKSFTFFRSYAEVLEEMTEKERKEFAVAIIDFVFKDKKPNFKSGSKLKAVWFAIEPHLIKSKNKSSRNQN